MKQKSFIGRLLLLLTILSITFSSCDDKGKISLDEGRASQQVIPIETAIEFQNNFLTRREELGKLVQDSSFLTQRFILSNAEAFNRDAIALLLNQAGADGIRIYLGNDAKSGEVKMVLLPVDKSGNDIITTLISNTNRGNTGITIPGISSAQAAPPPAGQAVETGQICPTCTIKSSNPSLR